MLVELTHQQEVILSLVSIPVVMGLCFLYVFWLLIKYYSDDVIYQYAQLGIFEWNWEVTSIRGKFWKLIVWRIERKIGTKLEITEESIEQDTSGNSTVWVKVKISMPSYINKKVRRLRT